MLYEVITDALVAHENLPVIAQVRPAEEGGEQVHPQGTDDLDASLSQPLRVITSYSIHYTKLYESTCQRDFAAL